VTDTTKNQGAAPAAGSATAFYLSPNTTINATDTLLGARQAGALVAGGSETVSTPLQIPDGLTPGTYYIIARADANATVPETIETNNDRASGAIQIGGDLVITAIGVPATGIAGGTLTVTDTTKNQNVAPVAQTSTGFYLSSNSTFETTDTFLGSRTVPALGSMGVQSGSTPVVVPQGTAPGTYYVIAVADWNNAVPESLETNNTRASSAVRIGPDLTVSSLNAPASAAAGATISGSDTTMNQGGESTPVSVTKFYLSTNTTLDASDPLIGTRQVIALGAGLSNSGSVSLTIPASTAPGTYTIIAKADGDDTIVESSEVNNTRTKTISITP
jgi:subtilase family serine protease